MGKFSIFKDEGFEDIVIGIQETRKLQIYNRELLNIAKSL